MKFSLTLEYLAFLGLGLYMFSSTTVSVWWFLALFLAPDISMIAYCFGPKVGAFCYNLCHHYGVAVVFMILAYYFDNQVVLFISSLLMSHISFDRILGYGLKYNKGFNYTHLGKIGRK